MISMAILKLGNEEQKRHYLPRLAQEDTIAAFALTESDAGSDAANIRATAKRVDGGYVLNGHKKFVGNADIADRAVIFATAGLIVYEAVLRLQRRLRGRGVDAALRAA